MSLRDTIFREVVANLIVHREFANAYPAKFIIEREGVRTENWNRQHHQGLLTPDKTVPFPKNPVIARFLREIGLVEELGSGLRNAFRFVPHYSGGQKPQFEEADVFTVRIPVGTNYDGNQDSNYVSDQTTAYTGKKLYALISEGVNEGVSEGVKQYLVQLVTLLQKSPGLNISSLAPQLGKGRSTVERYLRLLKDAGFVAFKGTPKTGGYFLTEAFTKRLADKGL